MSADDPAICWHSLHDRCWCFESRTVKLITYGRCRSGQRWFWAAEDTDGEHEHGWAGSEDAAVDAARGAVERIAAGQAAVAQLRQWAAASTLRDINAATRKARPASAATDAGVVEYLYAAWSSPWADDYTGKRDEEVIAFRITRKTPKRIYYIRSEGRGGGDPETGYISRQEFEADTRCREDCPRDVPARVCGRHERSHPHCVHWGVSWLEQDARCLGRGCGQDCPADTPGSQCAKHAWTWEHCPHGHRPGDCWKGDGPGEIRTRNHHEHDYHLFATREAAGEYLFRAERERERQRGRAEPGLKTLRKAMADAHPDRGGTSQGFIAARERYERALREAG